MKHASDIDRVIGDPIEDAVRANPKGAIAINGSGVANLGSADQPIKRGDDHGVVNIGLGTRPVFDGIGVDRVNVGFCQSRNAIGFRQRHAFCVILG